MKATTFRFRFTSTLILALCIVMGSSSLSFAQLGAVPVNIAIHTTPDITVTQNGSWHCTEATEDDYTLTSNYKLFPVIGDQQPGRVDFVCGGVTVAVFHELTVTDYGTDETDGTIQHPTRYTRRIAISVDYGDGQPITVADKTYDPDYLPMSGGSNAEGISGDDIKVLPGVRIAYVKDTINWSFGD